jgi:hypothetical protein
LVASATDNESGIQSLMIFADKAVTHCQGETCSGGSHPLLTNPTFQSTSPKKNPGEPMSPQSIMLQWIQLDTEIPQALPAAGSTRHIEWEISARAVNNYGMIANTPLFYASWSE